MFISKDLSVEVSTVDQNGDRSSKQKAEFNQMKL